MRIGINGSGQMLAADVGALTDDIAAAETDGFASYWLAGSTGIDALTVFAAHGASGSSTELGTAVIPTWTVHPQVLAAQALTTQAAVGGRLVLGIGLAHPPSVTERWKLEWDRPVRQMLDTLDILLPLMSEGRAHHEGPFWGYEGEMAVAGAPPRVMLAALGPQMLELAGRRTEGTILWCVGPKTISNHIAPRIRQAAAAADRPDPAIVCSVPVWVTDDPAPIREMIGRTLARYAELPSYRAMLDIEGLEGLGELSFVGSEAEVTDRIAEVAEAGATDFTAVSLGGSPDELARTRELLRSAIAEHA